MNLEQWGYLGILFVLLLCSLGLPLPEDVPLLTGGLMCYKGLAHVWIMIPVCMVGVLGGDFLLYWLGKRFGHRIVEIKFVRKLINPDRLVTAEHLFARHGFKIIFVGRFLPGLRPMLWVACGVLRVPAWIFATVNGAAACISVPTLVFLGKFFGHSFESIKKDVRTAMHLILLIVAILALAGLGYYFHKRQKGLLAEESKGPPVDAETLARMQPPPPPAPLGKAEPSP
jgi:membrane protein DedA with SNARE-associated domain